MSTTRAGHLPLIDGLTIQVLQLAALRHLLKDEPFLALIDHVVTENAKLVTACSGYEVFRGMHLDNYATNWAAKTFPVDEANPFEPRFNHTDDCAKTYVIIFGRPNTLGAFCVGADFNAYVCDGDDSADHISYARMQDYLLRRLALPLSA